MTTVITFNLKMDYKIHFEKLEKDFYTKLMHEDIRKKQEEIKLRALSDPKITYEQYR